MQNPKPIAKGIKAQPVIKSGNEKPRIFPQDTPKH